MLVQVGRRYVSEQREIDPMFAKGMKELLSRSKVFHDCHDEFIRDLIVSSNRKEFGLNRFLMEEGHRGESMFVLYKGVVEVTSGGRYVCKLRDGSIVGETALLNIDNRRTASVRSVQKCDVAIIFRSTFHSILEKYPWEKKKFQRDMKAKLMELGKLIDVKDDINLEQQAIQCDALKKVPFFAENEAMHDFVAELSMNASSAWYRPGRVIIQEGDTQCDVMYVLLHGAVEITACGEFLGRLENDLFGEICVLDLLERRTANVIAVTQCHCMMFTRQIVVPILAKYPEARMHLLQHARQRLMALNTAIGADPASTDMQATSLARYQGCAIGFGSALQQADAQLFAASKIFRHARVDFLRELSGAMTLKKSDEGKKLIEEGDAFVPDKDNVYWIARGQVEVWKEGNFITVLTEGDMFGELPLFSPGNIKVDDGILRREVTVKSKTKVVLKMVRGSVLTELLSIYFDPDLHNALINEVDARKLKMEKACGLSADKKILPLDFMFMKVPHTLLDGTRVPMHENINVALHKSGFQPVAPQPMSLEDQVSKLRLK
jgi:CRP-like cAMP-binding protein